MVSLGCAYPFVHVIQNRIRRDGINAQKGGQSSDFEVPISAQDINPITVVVGVLDVNIQMDLH